jgi:pimeloyl-ACP methyl ester carboxylesterase
MIAVFVLLALVLGIALYLYTPDKARAAMEAQYATAPSTFITIDGVRLHVRDTGPRAAPALLMLHGFGSSLQTWEAWAQALSTQYRAIRFDLPAFGLTGADPTGDYSDARSFQLIEDLMDRLGIARATLVGNSMGGGIAWRFAATHPARVDKLVLVSPEGFAVPGEDDRAAPPGPAKIPFTLQLMRFVLPTPLLRMNLAPSYADETKLTPGVMARYRDMLLVAGNRDAILARLMQMPQGQATRRNPVPLLRTIQAPTLLLWGEQDRLIPFSNAQDYLAALPDARLAALPGLGHVPQEEAPEVSLAPVVAFLNSD